MGSCCRTDGLIYCPVTMFRGICSGTASRNEGGASGPMTHAVFFVDRTLRRAAEKIHFSCRYPDQRSGGRRASVERGVSIMMSGRHSLRILLRLILTGALIGVGWSTLQVLQHNRAHSGRINAAYVFAVENSGVLEYIPCFCGCGYRLSHTSVESCFIASRTGEDGRDVVYDDHGTTCSQCVDIVHEVRILRESGQALPEIREIIERAFGPRDRRRWTPTPQVPSAP